MQEEPKCSREDTSLAVSPWTERCQPQSPQGLQKEQKRMLLPFPSAPSGPCPQAELERHGDPAGHRHVV